MVLGAVAPDVVVVVMGFPSLEASLSLVIGTGFKTMGLTFSAGSVAPLLGTSVTVVRGGGDVGGENIGEPKCV